MYVLLYVYSRKVSYRHRIELSPSIPPQPVPHTHTADTLSPLPLKPPSPQIYLWLAKEIRLWKFIARHLGLQESDIERIVSDFQGTDERCIQMFLRWEQRYSGTQCSYRKLGEVLKNSDGNKHLYDEYVMKVKGIEKLQ